MKYLSLILTLGAITLYGCAHATKRGSVAMKISEKEAHVCLGDDEVKKGDKVRAFYNLCTSKGGSQSGRSTSSAGPSPGSCEKKELGTGTVTQVLNKHYSVVEFDQDFKFDERSFVEKM